MLCKNSARRSKLADIFEISCSLIELRQKLGNALQRAGPNAQDFRLLTQPRPFADLRSSCSEWRLGAQCRRVPVAMRAGAATWLTKCIRCAAAKKAVLRCARSEIFSPMTELRDFADHRRSSLDRRKRPTADLELSRCEGPDKAAIRAAVQGLVQSNLKEGDCATRRK